MGNKYKSQQIKYYSGHIRIYVQYVPALQGSKCNLQITS